MSIKVFIHALVMFVILIISANAQVFNVMDYGATGDGKSDDSLAFSKSWNETCMALGNPTLIIPKGKTFLLSLTTFSGPCKSTNISIMLSGTIVAPNGPKEWKASDISRWLTFKDIHGLTVTGFGLIDGRGKDWWGVSCRYYKNKECLTQMPTFCRRLFPTPMPSSDPPFVCLPPWKTNQSSSPMVNGGLSSFMEDVRDLIRLYQDDQSELFTGGAHRAVRFENCEDIRMNNIYFVNSPQCHILVSGCRYVDLRFLNIKASADSPNTDGIHISSSHNVSLQHLTIGTGDDCISIGDYTSNINIVGVRCGPGHGISIGSLGGGGNEVQVENITVHDAHFYGSTNGVRIKTWQVGRGNVKNIHFSNLTFENVDNPIIIDQHYGDLRAPPTNTGVHISNVSYYGATGSSKTKVAINLNCSSIVPCTDITLENIKLDSAVAGNKLSSSCNFAHGFTKGYVTPSSCLVQ
ncbi:probable polygalacturonase At1g80170 [Mercurialis annua]|uniref:probable polygalacturonase At1g80170 n=1 Tax=Mercurialis annua TaxID=3986 RepID=UPI00215F1915|nr:probable polygalacturonase At1g80170 [Mercurialis annua]